MTNVLHEQPVLNDTALTYNVCLLCLLLAYYLFASLNITFRIIGGLFYFFLLWFSMLVYLSQNMYKCENVLLNNHFQSLCAD